MSDDPVWERLTRLTMLTERIAALVRRKRTRHWQMPIFCLTAGSVSTPLLSDLDRLLTVKGRQIPHAVLDARSFNSLEALVRAARDQLQQNRFGTEPLCFPHLSLLCRVFDADLREEAAEAQEAALRGLLAEDYRIDRSAMHGWQSMMYWPIAMLVEMLVRGLPRVLLRVRHWRRMRWFTAHLREETGCSTSFWPFAVRLTAGLRDSEDPAMLRRLVVAAFLQDMRTMYAGSRRRWHWTAYPVLLVDGVRDVNVGGDLLTAISDVRNGGVDDPLVVVADIGSAHHDMLAPLAGLDARLDTWAAELPAARRRGDARAWLLHVRMPDEDLGPAARRHRPIVPPPPPWAARPALRVGAFATVVLLVATLAVVGSGAGVPGLLAGCSSIHRSGFTDVTLVGDECVGLTDTAAQLLGNDKDTRNLEETVFKENRDAEEHRRDHPEHPLLTLVYLTTLTRPKPIPGDDPYVAEREGLLGISKAQHAANVEADQNGPRPYVRVVVANTGQQARQAATVVPMITKLAAEDSSVLGVIAAVDSRAEVEKALKQLSGRLTVISPTMDADNIAAGSKLFLRISSPNRDAAGLAHHYITTIVKRTRVFNVYTYGRTPLAPGEQDLYVDTLDKDLKHEFGTGYDGRFWNVGDSLRDLCADRYDGVVFFGGRYSEVGSFLHQIAGDCGANPPVLLTDGSTTRFLASDTLRAGVPSPPLAFLADGYLGSCARLNDNKQPEQDLYKNMLGDRCTKGPLGVEAAGWSMLSFDAARMLIWSMGEAMKAVGMPTPGDTWYAPINSADLFHWITSRNEPYPGVTGPIAFDNSGTATNRYRSVLCVTEIATVYTDTAHLPVEVDRQGNGYPNTPQPTGLPCTAGPAAGRGIRPAPVPAGATENP